MTTRARLTVSYAVVLIATMITFAVAVFTERRNAARQDLAEHVFRQGDRVLAIIHSAQRAGKRLTVHDTTHSFGEVRVVTVVRPTQDVAELLDPLPGYFLLIDSQDKLLYS